MPVDMLLPLLLLLLMMMLMILHVLLLLLLDVCDVPYFYITKAHNRLKRRIFLMK